tara:strand:- start:232 stop:1101 length:870 start_codon:yes stop_codon:yes gene_type:complete
MTETISSQTALQAGLNISDLENLIKIAKESSLLGGEILKKYYGNIKKLDTKSNKTDLVTNADIEAEQSIINYLKLKSPSISILAEESGESITKNPLKWCIDPLDGTTNYANGYPFFATSIGLIWNNRPILGAITIPILSETYYAAPGIGAFCNDQKICVSNKDSLEDSLLVTGFAYDRKETLNNNYAEFAWLTNLSRGVRRGGAAAVDLAFTACGRLDGYWERGLSKWDLAAGVAIVENAGGIISDYPTGSFNLNNGRILASTPKIADELKIELGKVKPLEKKFFTEIA